MAKAKTVCKRGHPKPLGGMCKVCHNERQKIRSKKDIRAANGGSVHISPLATFDPTENYIVDNCELCDIQFFPKRTINKLCNDCYRICHRVKQTVSGYTHRSMKGQHYDLTRECILIVAKNFLQATVCAYCGGAFTENNSKSLDHIVPLSRGGGATPDNIAICHTLCNDSKGTHTLSEWIDLCAHVCMHATNVSIPADI